MTTPDDSAEDLERIAQAIKDRYFDSREGQASQTESYDDCLFQISVPVRG